MIPVMVGSFGLLVWATILQLRAMKGQSSAPMGWAIWSFVSGTSVAAQMLSRTISLDAWSWLLMPVAQLVSMIALTATATSLAKKSRSKTKVGKLADKYDWWALGICLLGTLAWAVTAEPLIAIGGNVAANLAGAWAIARGLWRDPTATSRLFWLLQATSAAAAAVVVWLEIGLHWEALIPQSTGVAICTTMIAISVMRKPPQPAQPQEVQPDLVQVG